VSRVGIGEFAMVEVIMQIARTLRLELVAEGVESAGQVGRLRGLGCELAQGYHFAKPLEAEVLVDQLRAVIGAGADRS
jgi:EAL domain-containing protein (putative c-di-GMP-specific phosphodiesterase class I)